MPRSALHTETLIPPPQEHPLPQAAVAALWQGQRIDAIKMVRMERQIDLKEAKELVDAYLHTQPIVRSLIEQTQADTREGLIRWFLFFLFGGAGLMFLLS